MAELEVDSAELSVIELDGFLNSLRCLVGCQGRLFSAAYISKKGKSLKEIVKELISKNTQAGRRISMSEACFEKVSELFEQCIYAQLSHVSRENIKNLDWNLVEYYGLISTAEDESGPWNRLVGQKHVLLESENDKGWVDIVFFVEYENFVVATFLAKNG
ncbi:hypothetical protein [Marinobacter zhejiangensis]|uniref:Uncharacterized protein n=1 Tax=Marinobacter zhejiangensis TaxID=488535 RepID=A0A1I4T3E4_9GAMM|nr:hypothetical protein [Marinobacter zhejiangensis]SFM71189.1 hypothetical protein SAMN04487963_3470 [Marinobacter zhejiangensis]